MKTIILLVLASLVTLCAEVLEERVKFVGVNTQGRVVFAITEPGQLVNLWDFAGLFLKLGCQNALFLDGDISQMAVNPPKPLECNQYGAMFVVTE